MSSSSTPLLDPVNNNDANEPPKYYHTTPISISKSTAELMHELNETKSNRQDIESQIVHYSDVPFWQSRHKKFLAILTLFYGAIAIATGISAWYFSSDNTKEKTVLGLAITALVSTACCFYGMLVPLISKCCYKHGCKCCGRRTNAFNPQEEVVIVSSPLVLSEAKNLGIAVSGLNNSSIFSQFNPNEEKLGEAIKKQSINIQRGYEQIKKIIDYRNWLFQIPEIRLMPNEVLRLIVDYIPTENNDEKTIVAKKGYK